jgi:uncharacterized phage infection (PIP) family protein YhgE
MTTAKRTTTADVSGLYDRLDKTERDFLGHLQKVEDRLNQIAELTKTVTVLQQQSIQQTDQIQEIRASLKENATKFDNSITRIHTRLDDIVSHNRDKLELHSKEFEIKIDTVKAKANQTDESLKSWLNRGWGAWAIFTLVMTVTGAGFYRWVDTIDKDKIQAVQVTKDLTVFKDRTEIFIKQHELDNNEVKAKVVRLEAGQRDLEDMMSRRSQK